MLGCIITATLQMPQWIECFIFPFSNLLVVMISGRLDLSWIKPTRANIHQFNIFRIQILLMIGAETFVNIHILSCRDTDVHILNATPPPTPQTRRAVPLSHTQKSRLDEVLTELLVVSGLDHHFQQRADLRRSTRVSRPVWLMLLRGVAGRGCLWY